MSVPLEQADGYGVALAGALQEGLLPGAQVLVRWRDASGLPGFSLTGSVSPRLTQLAEQVMHSGQAPTDDPNLLALVWDGDGGSRADASSTSRIASGGTARSECNARPTRSIGDSNRRRRSSRRR